MRKEEFINPMSEREFIKTLHSCNLGEDEHGIKNLIESYFPELVKEDLKNGDIVYPKGTIRTIYKITDIDKTSAYGFDNGVWRSESSGWTFNTHPNVWKKTTTETWKEMLIKECQSRGIWDTKDIVPLYGFDKEGTRFEAYDFENDQLWSRFGVVYANGEFAQPKPKTELDLEIETLSKISFRVIGTGKTKIIGVSDIDETILDRVISRLKKLRGDV